VKGLTALQKILSDGFAVKSDRHQHLTMAPVSAGVIFIAVGNFSSVSAG